MNVVDFLNKEINFQSFLKSFFSLDVEIGECTVKGFQGLDEVRCTIRSVGGRLFLMSNDFRLDGSRFLGDYRGWIYSWRLGTSDGKYSTIIVHEAFDSSGKQIVLKTESDIFKEQVEKIKSYIKEDPRILKRSLDDKVRSIKEKLWDEIMRSLFLLELFVTNEDLISINPSSKRPTIYGKKNYTKTDFHPTYDWKIRVNKEDFLALTMEAEKRGIGKISNAISIAEKAYLKEQ